MSKMKDLWGDTIEVTTDEGLVGIHFTEHDFDYVTPNESNMELDAVLARKLVKKLKKAIAEVEDM